LEYSKLITYISEIGNRKKNLKMQQDKILVLFATSPPLSVYKIFHNHKSIHKMNFPKDVRKIVKQLLDLKLIENVENKISKHRAIDYRLSTGGLCYLIYNKKKEFIGLFNTVLQHYDQNIIFTTLLYPYLQKSSLVNIIDTTQISRICAYLHDCYEEIENVLESKEKNYSKSVVQQVCLWNDVHEKGADNNRLINFLKGEFDLNWLNNRAEVTKYGNDSTIRISKDSKRVLIRLNKKMNEAIMTVNRNEVYKFSVSPGLQILYRQEQTAEELSISFFISRVKSLAADLVITLSSRAIIDSDIKILSEDETFMRWLDENKKRFDDKYEKLVNFV
jgi:hypothetical protein